MTQDSGDLERGGCGRRALVSRASGRSSVSMNLARPACLAIVVCAVRNHSDVTLPAVAAVAGARPVVRSAAVVGAGPGVGVCYLDEAGAGHREVPAAWAGPRAEGFLPRRGLRGARGPWLGGYGHQRGGSRDVARLLRKALAERAPLMAGAAAAGDPLAVLPVLFHLMWLHVLQADLAVRLTAESLVSAGGAG